MKEQNKQQKKRLQGGNSGRCDEKLWKQEKGEANKEKKNKP